MLSTCHRRPKPPVDLAAVRPEADAIKRAVLRALDDAGQHWEATNWFISSYDNDSPNGLRIAAARYVIITPWPIAR
jgi:hypothetical protein